MNNMRAFVRYDSKGIIVPTSFVMKKSKPKVGNWLEISTTKSTVNPPDGSSLGNLRAFVRYNAQNKIVPGSVVVRSQVPQSGNWGEITYSTARPISGGAPLILQYTITAPATQISIPLGTSAYSFEADWGDGTTTGPLESADGTLLNPLMVHTYADPGVYNITISGSAFPYFNLYSSPDAATKTQLTNIVQWGSFNWESFADTFRGCTALTSVGSGDAPILTLTTSLESMFNGCTAITNWSNLATWNTAAVTSLESTFNDSSFDDVAATYVAGWDVANVTNLFGTFQNTAITSIDLSGWNVSSATDMTALFANSASLTTTNLSGWDVSSTTNMSFMFSGTAVGVVTGIENWQIAQVADFSAFMFGCPGLSTAVYDQLLVNWDAQGAMSFAGTVDFGCSVYTEAWAPGAPGPETSRTSLIAKWGGINDCGGTPDVTGFIIEVDTEGNGNFVGQNTFQVRTSSYTGGYNYNIETSDGQIINGLTSNYIITFPSPGIYNIKITGSFPSFFIGVGTTSIGYKVNDVKAWGPNQWTTFRQSFYGAKYMTISAPDAPDLSLVTNMIGAFGSCDALVAINNSSSWDTSNITNMSQIFYASDVFNDPGIASWNTSNVISMAWAFRDCPLFNQNLGAWDVSNVTTMEQMFYNAQDFNNGGSGDINNWNTISVTDMNNMFFNADAFNQNIGNWNTSNVTTMSSMFESANTFNNGGIPDINNWNTSSVTTMAEMFRSTPFNQPIGSWDVSSVTNMSSMFYQNSSFNQDLGAWNTINVTNMFAMFGVSAFNNGGSASINNWNTSSVTTMQAMFYDNTAFNQPIGNWNTSNVTTMYQMFLNSPVFNQDISTWDTSSVTTIQSMFSGATAFNNGGQPLTWNTSAMTNMSAAFYISGFNQDITTWNTSNVTRFDSMFYDATSFNQDISVWNTSSGTNMQNMFRNATAFNYPLGDWNISNVTNFIDFMRSKTSADYSTGNLDDIYTKWSAQTVSPNESINFGTIQYTIAGGQAGRNILTGAPNNWTIVDGGGI